VSAGGLTHVDAAGNVRMVDVSEKDVTVREAVASGVVRMAPATVVLIRENGLAKGDVLGTARLAGIMAAKRTAELIPLCHPLPLDGVEVACDLDDSLPGVRVSARVRTTGRTGVEMEALTAVSVAMLTLYDMAKAVDRGMVLADIRLDEKTGGRSGTWRRPDGP